MEKQKFSSFLIRIALIFFAVILFLSCNEQTKKVYEPTRESLETHHIPDWFRDAKFGIFIHWGVYAVPAYHEWYVVFMSPKSGFGRNLGGPPYTAAQGDLSDSVFNANIRQEANRYHRENFGVDFAYDEFIPIFKAENYDPASWAELFREAGAKYVVMTAKHGDEFALWPSKYTSRNAMDMGPHRDLAGDLAKEVRSHGMKMGFYHNTTYSFWDERYPDKEWVEYMNNSIKELVDLYQPDVLWGDVFVGPVRDENGKPLGADHWNSKEVISYFYNHSKNPDEVLTNDRWGLDTSGDTGNSKNSISQSLWGSHAKKRWNIDNGAFLGDFQSPERRNITEIYNSPWETCDALDPTSWGYNTRLPEDKYMKTNELVDYLADIVSKGGNLLINIGPKADGTIPEVMQDRLRGVGSWLSVNGEAIYGTRPWKVYGEGPTVEEIGSWGRKHADYSFKKGDVRFTRKGNNLYVIMLEWPGEEISLTSLKDLDIKRASLLGSNEKIEWNKSGEVVTISLPPGPVSPYANVLKLRCKGL
jgi:alpha-L-fucosidase